MYQTAHMRLNVFRRRMHWENEEDGWVCDGCGCDNEELLCMWQTGRVTRSDPNGEKIVCLCCDCGERIPHGAFVDQ